MLPCALQHEMLLRRQGILQPGHASKDSVSAVHRFGLHRARNDNNTEREPIVQI